jgi:hypothetical protein
MNFKWMIRLVFLCVVFGGFSSSKAGIYDDFFMALRQEAVVLC